MIDKTTSDSEKEDKKLPSPVNRPRYRFIEILLLWEGKVTVKDLVEVLQLDRTLASKMLTSYWQDYYLPELSKRFLKLENKCLDEFEKKKLSRYQLDEAREFLRLQKEDQNKWLGRGYIEISALLDQSSLDKYLNSLEEINGKFVLYSPVLADEEITFAEYAALKLDGAVRIAEKDTEKAISSLGDMPLQRDVRPTQLRLIKTAIRNWQFIDIIYVKDGVEEKRHILPLYTIMAGSEYYVRAVRETDEKKLVFRTYKSSRIHQIQIDESIHPDIVKSYFREDSQREDTKSEGGKKSKKKRSELKQKSIREIDKSLDKTVTLRLKPHPGFSAPGKEAVKVKYASLFGDKEYIAFEVPEVVLVHTLRDLKIPLMPVDFQPDYACDLHELVLDNLVEILDLLINTFNYDKQNNYAKLQPSWLRVSDKPWEDPKEWLESELQKNKTLTKVGK